MHKSLSNEKHAFGRRGVPRNVTLMLCIAFLQGLVFYAAISTVHKAECGLSLLEVTGIESLHALLMLLLIIPWGVFADRVGYKRTLILCNALYLVSKLSFFASDGYGLFLAERLFRAAAVSGLATCNSAFLFLSADDTGARRTFSRYTAASAAGVLVSALALSSVLQNDIHAASGLTVAAFAVAFVLTLFLKEVGEANKNGPGLNDSLKKAAMAMVKKRRFLMFITASALFEESAYLFSMVFNQPLFQSAGIPEDVFGYLYALARGMTMLAIFSPALVKRLGEKCAVFWLISTGALCCAVLALTHSAVVAVLAVAVLRTASGLFAPVKMSLQNREIDVDERATMLAAFYIVSRACMAVSDYAAGAAANVDMSLCAAVLCALCALALVLFSLWSKKGLPD